MSEMTDAADREAERLIALAKGGVDRPSVLDAGRSAFHTMAVSTCGTEAKLYLRERLLDSIRQYRVEQRRYIIDGQQACADRIDRIASLLEEIVSHYRD